MNLLRYTILLLIVTACKGQDTQSSSMAKDTPEVRALIERFNQQEHRLEINDCEVVYNGKSFFLGDTLEEVEAILGKKYDYRNFFAYLWKDINLKVIVEKESMVIHDISIYISEGYKKIIEINKNIILVNSVPISKETDFGDFIKTSNYNFDDFIINRSFELKIDNCKEKRVALYFISDPVFDYSGSGHLQIRGDFNPNKTFPVKNINIFEF